MFFPGSKERYLFIETHIWVLKNTFAFWKPHCWKPHVGFWYLCFENRIRLLKYICVFQKPNKFFWQTFSILKNYCIWIMWSKPNLCFEIQICVIKRKCGDFQMWFLFLNYVNPNLVFEKPHLVFRSRICVLKHKLKNRP